MRLLKAALLVAIFTCLMASPAWAHHWGTFDVTNSGRVASVLNETKWDAVVSAWESDLNSRAGTHGVILKNDGQAGTGGIDYEIRIYDNPNHPAYTGADYNSIFCEGGRCRSWSVISLSPYGAGTNVMHHEGFHSYSAPHEPCNVLRTIMHGAPYTPCSTNIIVNNGAGSHDWNNYSYNKSIGVYDESMGATSLATSGSSTLATDEPLTEHNVVEFAKFNAAKADEVRIKHKNGGILVKQVYYPHKGR